MAASGSSGIQKNIPLQPSVRVKNDSSEAVHGVDDDHVEFDLDELKEQF